MVYTMIYTTCRQDLQAADPMAVTGKAVDCRRATYGCTIQVTIGTVYGPGQYFPDRKDNQ